MGHLHGLGITRGGKGQILSSCGPADTDHHGVIPKILVPRGPGRGQLLAPQHLPGLQGGISGVCVGSHGRLGLGACGEGWLGFQIHWFTEEPAREGQGAACLVIVIVLITRAGSEQDPTPRQVPPHPLLSICATIPAEHPARPGPCSPPKGGSQCPHPCQTSRVTPGVTLTR